MPKQNFPNNSTQGLGRVLKVPFPTYSVMLCALDDPTSGYFSHPYLSVWNGTALPRLSVIQLTLFCLLQGQYRVIHYSPKRATVVTQIVKHDAARRWVHHTFDHTRWKISCMAFQLHINLCITKPYPTYSICLTLKKAIRKSHLTYPK